MVLFWILLLLALLPAVEIVVPDAIPTRVELVEEIGRLMVLLEIMLLLAPSVNCTPQPDVTLASRVRMKLSTLTKSARLKVTMPWFTPAGVAEMVLPLPLKVTVLVALVPLIEPKINCSLYGPVPVTTLKITGPVIPQLLTRAAASDKLWKFVPAVGLFLLIV